MNRKFIRGVFCALLTLVLCCLPLSLMIPIYVRAAAGNDGQLVTTPLGPIPQTRQTESTDEPDSGDDSTSGDTNVTEKIKETTAVTKRSGIIVLTDRTLTTGEPSYHYEPTVPEHGETLHIGETLPPSATETTEAPDTEPFSVWTDPATDLTEPVTVPNVSDSTDRMEDTEAGLTLDEKGLAAEHRRGRTVLLVVACAAVIATAAVIVKKSEKK